MEQVWDMALQQEEKLWFKRTRSVHFFCGLLPLARRSD